jgi:tetratricopeptide (TPR) repeat protein
MMNTNKEIKEMHGKSRSIQLGRTQLFGALVVVVLIGLGMIYRSSNDSTVQTLSSEIATTSVQKTLLQTAEEALALNPQDSEAWYTKGVYLQIEVGDNQGAVESYSRAIEIDPGFLSALFNRGLALKNLGRLDEAKVDFEAIVFSKEGSAPRALYNLGLIAKDQGDTALSDEYLQNAYEQDPTLQP